jgi:hypothetical protein
MAKKQTFVDKLRKGGKEGGGEYVKVVKAYKGENGAWKFQTSIVEVTDQNRDEIYK